MGSEEHMQHPPQIVAIAPNNSKMNRAQTLSTNTKDFAHQYERKASVAPLVTETPKKHKTPRSLVLCFDGTGNGYIGDGTETNVWKIFQMLDKHDENQYHYYQPGLGTYVARETLDKWDIGERIEAAARKVMDLAVGTSLSEHVLGGYKFLMRYYSGPADKIYIFGFSRGAYTARFLAEMLDDVGLLPAGNEEMVNFAWKLFSKWQTRGAYEAPPKGKKPSKAYERAQVLARTMAGFKEAFSRPMGPVRFLGLFDTVNSVPEFEIPWMARRRFPYSARSGATEIWHAVSIDERRVKFRPDLIYQTNVHSSHGNDTCTKSPPLRTATMSPISPETLDQHNHANPNQRVHEVWFAGNHGDVGGGWAPPASGGIPLSHIPLMWMIRAAISAGLQFDMRKLIEAEISLHDLADGTFASLSPTEKRETTATKIQHALAQQHHDMLSRGDQVSRRTAARWSLMEWIPFRRMDLRAADGKWVPKRWPPSRGEMRDIPAEAQVHGSVILRMQLNEKYRPHNLILGGGREPGSRKGKGILRVKGQVVDFKMADWEVLPDFSDLDMLERVYVRRKMMKGMTI